MTTLMERLNKLTFGRLVQRVLETPPLARGGNEFIALSMVHHRDVAPYLLAIKSFASAARPARIVVVSDPSITEADAALLRAHVPHIELLPASRFRHPALPVGGCWERLSAIAELNAEAGIVQVDADTLTTGPLDEVVRAMADGRNFLLRSEAGIEITDLARAAAHGRMLLGASNHIQAIVESRLDELDMRDDWRYARGCAGFTGFAHEALRPARLRQLSEALRALHGPRWDDWGSEQVTSNLLAASAPGAFMLPHPAYCNADSQAADTRFAHYIGYARFTTRAYECKGRTTIDGLMRR